MKRFWKDAAAVERDGSWIVELDGRPVHTPARQLLRLPNSRLAQAIAVEWGAASETVEPSAMPLTGLANAAIDHVAPQPDRFARGLARYGESDLLCYRADSPPEVVERQERKWGVLLAWARRRYDVDFAVTAGIVHTPQPPATIERLAHAVATLDAFRLAGLAPLVTIGGSLVAALAVADEAVTAEEAWQAVSLDERWQIEKWGEDPEAVAAVANRRAQFLSASRFLELLR